jgi:hypothetical protein
MLDPGSRPRLSATLHFGCDGVVGALSASALDVHSSSAIHAVELRAARRILFVAAMPHAGELRLASRIVSVAAKLHADARARTKIFKKLFEVDLHHRSSIVDPLSMAAH